MKPHSKTSYTQSVACVCVCCVCVCACVCYVPLATLLAMQKALHTFKRVLNIAADCAVRTFN